MTIQNNTLEKFAESFYRYHEALAPDFGGMAHLEPEWDRLESSQRKHYIAAARLAFLDLRSDFERGDGELLRDWSSGGTEGRECGA